MKIINKKCEKPQELKVSRRKTILKVFGISTEMKELGITVESTDELFGVYIENCLDSKVVLNFIKRFLMATSIQEIHYLKLLTRRGLIEGQVVELGGTKARIMPFNEAKSDYPCYSLEKKNGGFSKQKRLIYNTVHFTGYKDFNNRIN